jgi:superfamily II DNA or RNA helicase
MTDRPDAPTELARAEARLAELDAERARIQARIEALRAAATPRPGPAISVPAPPARALAVPTTQAEKVSLFASLFRGRTDVYPRRWENPRTGKSGYSPHCANEWQRGVCGKPKVKCGDCPVKAFVPVTDRVLHDHLKGEIVAGVYPLVEGDRCHFVAVDFDGSGWQGDVSAFAETARVAGLPVAVERSRSGNGAHAWFFFGDAVPAVSARQMASYLLTETMSRRSEIGMRSYDRLFPNQDTLPRGGFGNLIALPLQWEARRKGNSVFVDEAFTPFEDQWAFLAGYPRIPGDTVALVAREALRQGRVLGVRFAPTVEEEVAPWARPPSGLCRRSVPLDQVPERIQVVLGQRVFVDRAGLSPPLVTEIRRLASFQNPVFYEKQAMRFSTGGIPRVVTCAEETERHVALPRGCLGALEELASGHGVRVVARDERVRGRPLDVRFQGTLTEDQRRASRALSPHEIGVLVAPPGTGKTVLAAHLIAERAVNALVLVHRRPLADQWVARLAAFLDLDPKEIGIIGGGKRKPTGRIDVATFQSLVRGGSVKDVVADYGHVVVDECHHVSAVSFERVLSEVKARYVLGLTATPRRRDGHHPIVEMQLGPVRVAIGARDQAAAQGFAHRLIARETAFRTDWSRERGIQALYAKLAADETRNALLLDDVIASLEAGRSPLLLTERRDHLDYLARKLRPAARHLVVLHGGMKAKERRAALAALSEIPAAEERAVIATGRFIGEGFDDPRLDTLVLAMPVAWRGTLVQYAGRLHRIHAGKSEVRIYDYVDGNVPVLARMFGKRLRGYRALGYEDGLEEAAKAGARELTIEYDAPVAPTDADP